MPEGRPAVTLVIGRSADADIPLADPSVAERHAELVVAADGRYHLTDCASGAGTWWRPAGDPGAAWQPVRQAFVRADDALRVGAFACTLGGLLADVATAGGGEVPARRGAERPRGRVERDPHTGEIVRKRV